AQRLVVDSPLREQEALDPVDVLDAFGDQSLALAPEPSAILLLGARGLGHRTDPGLAALEGHQRAKQRLAVDAVGLGPPAPARHGDRSGVDNVAFDPLLLQRPVNPEPVQSRFLNDDDRIGRSGPRQRLALKLRQAFEKPPQISCRRLVLRHLLARPWRNRRQKPSRTAQFQRDENRANIHSDSGRRIGPLNSLEHRPLQSEVVAASLWQSAGRYPPPWNLRSVAGGDASRRTRRCVATAVLEDSLRRQPSAVT